MYCKKNTTPHTCWVVSLPFSRIWVWFLVLRPTYTDWGFLQYFSVPSGQCKYLKTGSSAPLLSFSHRSIEDYIPYMTEKALSNELQKENKYFSHTIPNTAQKKSQICLRYPSLMHTRKKKCSICAFKNWFVIPSFISETRKIVGKNTKKCLVV